MSNFDNYKLKNGKTKWLVNAYWGLDSKTGEEIRIRKRGFNSRGEAKTYYEREVIRLNDEANVARTKEIKFEELYEKYLEFYLNAGYAESTYYTMKCAMDKHVLPYFKSFIVSMITVSDCQNMVNETRKKRKDFKKLAGYARGLFKYAANEGYIKKNPMDHVILKSGKKTYKKREVSGSTNYYNPEQLITFLDYYKNHGKFHEYVYFRLLAFSGLRRGEALALYTSDLNHKNKSINVSKTLTTDKKGKTVLSLYTKTDSSESNKTEHIVYLDDVTYQVVNQLIKQSIDSGSYISDKEYLFVSSHSGSNYNVGTPNGWLTAFWDKHEKELKKLNLKYITPHGFRHSQATLLYELGIDPKDAQHRLRHRNIETTMDIYTHISENREKETTNALNSFETNRTKNRTKIINLFG